MRTSFKHTMKTALMTSALTAILSLSIAQSGEAAVIQKDFEGNDCSGFFGTGFDSCTIFVDDNGVPIELSPVIAKFGANGGAIETNGSIYPSVTGDEFSFSGTNGPSGTSGTWTYNPEGDDPGVRYWAAKAGPNFRLFWIVPDADVSACAGDAYNLACLNLAQTQTSGAWDTFDGLLNGSDLSHLTFYDTEIDDDNGGGTPPGIPEPATLALIGAGLAGLGVATRRRRRQT